MRRITLCLVWGILATDSLLYRSAKSEDASVSFGSQHESKETLSIGPLLHAVMSTDAYASSFPGLAAFQRESPAIRETYGLPGPIMY